MLNVTKISKYGERERDVFYDELAHVIMEADSPKICSQPAAAQDSHWGRRPLKTSSLKTQEELMFQFKKRQEKPDVPNSNRQEEFSLTLRKVRLFVPFRPSTDWMRAAHTVEGHLLYSV